MQVDPLTVEQVLTAVGMLSFFIVVCLFFILLILKFLGDEKQ